MIQSFTKSQANLFWFFFVMTVLTVSAACLGSEPPAPSKPAEVSNESLQRTMEELQKNIEALKLMIKQNQPAGREDDGKYRPMISSTRPLSVSDPEKFAAYRQRLATRRAYALEKRRQLNAGKYHVYYRIHPGLPAFGWSAIQAGMLRQPPIPTPGGSRRCVPRRPVTIIPDHY